jgi:hypothetical protein
MKIAAWLLYAGCAVFFIYGMSVVFLSELTAAYNYEAAMGKSFSDLSGEAQEMMSDMVMLIGLLGAGLSICSGALFWYGLSQRNRWLFLLGVVGGAFGVASLLTIHLDQKAWVLFIVDNVCFTFINLGFMAGGRELLDFIRNNTEEEGVETA